MTYSKHWERSIGFLFVFSVVGVLLADFLLYDMYIGCNIALFIAFLTCGLVVKHQRVEFPAFARIIYGALIGLIFSLISDPYPLNILLSILLLILLSLTLSHGRTAIVREWVLRLRFFLAQFCFVLIRDINSIKRRRERTKKNFSGLTSFISNWSIPAALALVFFLLFAAANPLLTVVVEDIWEILEECLKNISFRRILFWIFILAATWALLRGRVRYPRHCMRGTLPIFHKFTAGMVIRCLALLNLVFAPQVFSDLWVLWADASLPHNVTYAQYAHQGAYTLLFTALLAAAVILALFKIGDEANEKTAAKQLVYAWIVQNVIILLCSVQRLYLYVDAYGLTRWRLAAAIWMLLVTIGFLLIGFRINLQKSNNWLWQRNILMLFSVLYLCSFINIDGAIAWHNVKTCRDLGGRAVYLDIYYLRRLGPEALPALEYYLEQFQKSNGKRTLINYQQEKKVTKVKRQLIKQLEQQLINWRGWSIESAILFQRYLKMRNIRIKQSS